MLKHSGLLLQPISDYHAING
uniref:Uncharacterized protein n=1 Tax=Arundo donax TaxID=35708 RepID=A0A0A8YA28_ARUDO